MALDITAARSRATQAVKSFSPQQLLILGGLLVVSVMGLIALMRWVSQPSYGVLMAGASTSEISGATAALNTAGIQYQMGAAGNSLMVPNASMAAARLALSDAGVNISGEALGYDLLDKQGLTTSDFKQRVDLQRALEGQITNMLLDMDAIDSAKVQLSIPEKALFSDDQQVVRASVLVGTNARMDTSTVRAIMQTVAAAVPDLDPKNVTVTDTSGQILSVDGLSSGDDPLAMARKYEAATAAQVQTMLDTILGPGHSVVRVSAEMDFDKVESKSTSVVGAAVPIASQESKETFTGPGATIPAGVIGVTGTTLATGDILTTQDYQKSDTVTSATVGGLETVTQKNPGTVKRLSVAVAVDQATIATLGTDTATLIQLVQAAVGADPNRPDNIVVQEQAFDTATADASQKAVESASSAKTKTAIIGYVKTGAAAVVLLLTVLFLRKGLRARTEEVDEIDTATLARSSEPFGVLASSDQSAPLLATASSGAGRLGSPTAGALGAANDDDAAPGERRALDAASEVLDLIDREPDDVAALLRSWVADRRS